MFCEMKIGAERIGNSNRSRRKEGFVRFLEFNGQREKEERIVLYISVLVLEGLKLKGREEVNKTQKLRKIMNAEETSNFLVSSLFFL